MDCCMTDMASCHESCSVRFATFGRAAGQVAAGAGLWVAANSSTRSAEAGGRVMGAVGSDARGDADRPASCTVETASSVVVTARSSSDSRQSTPRTVPCGASAGGAAGTTGRSTRVSSRRSALLNISPGASTVRVTCSCSPMGLAALSSAWLPISPSSRSGSDEVTGKW